MSIGDTTITVIGNLTADPDMRYTPAGVAVAAFTVASTRRTYDKQTGKWADGDTLFLRCSVWREVADHVTESLTKGTRVIVTGRLKQRDYEDKDGIKRTIYEIDVEEVGPSLRFATAKPTKAARQNAPHPADTPGGDPWTSTAQPAGVGAAGGWNGGGDEPPF
ncbi:single-stranded DNA-binding protein [Nonomuraea sp. NPDC050556]|uniref:single-stranded DNA-binding protein n=1 Tax=Nonomuraea sp. NPDC050556 TaxID=3364369 RepID=UPI0037977843